jgi:nicotinate-nucleotide--dimethylbenzimidazole phosphoribosyltransferase
MKANFQAGGAAICQIAREAGASLRLFPLELDRPTVDITEAAAMTEAEFGTALSTGWHAVIEGCDLVCLGEMGIGNTTAAAALAAALFGGSGADWAGRGTGIDDAGLARKRQAIDAALDCHAGRLGDPFEAARLLGGRELAAILGAALRARTLGTPVLLDGFVCTAAAAPLACLAADGLAHAILAHRSAEAAHTRLAALLGLAPLLDLGMRLGEGSGAALAIPLLRAALACHAGMATFAEAGVSDRDGG